MAKNERTTDLETVTDPATGITVFTAPYHGEINALIKSIDGKYDGIRGVWVVPAERKGDVKEVFGRIVELDEQIKQARRDVVSIADTEARTRSTSENPGMSQISDFFEREKPVLGEVISKNDYFAVQLTGYGSKDGAAFLQVHSLDRVVEGATEMVVGKFVSVSYDQKNQSRVEPAERTTALERLNASLAHEVDGVRVERKGENLHVKFAYNEPLNYRLRKAVPDSKFDREAIAHIVPAEKVEDLARAVSGMRKEYAGQQREVEHITASLAWMEKKPKVTIASTHDGLSTSGTIVEITDRFVAQASSPGQVTLHHKGSLKREGVEEKDPTVMKGDKVKITYDKGRGTVEPAKERDKVPERKPASLER